MVSRRRGSSFVPFKNINIQESTVEKQIPHCKKSLPLIDKRSSPEAKNLLCVKKRHKASIGDGRDIWLAEVIFCQHKELFFKDGEPAVNKGRYLLMFEVYSLFVESQKS